MIFAAAPGGAFAFSSSATARLMIYGSRAPFNVPSSLPELEPDSFFAV
jgi:hypothetical protein